MRRLRCTAAALVGLGLGGIATQAAAQAPTTEGRWRAQERCDGDSSSRNFILSSDGTMLTARLPGPDVNSFGAIIGFTPLLPGGRFSIDVAMAGADAKSTYTGRVHTNRTITAEGGAWSGSNFRPCRLSISWLGPLPAGSARAPAASGGSTAGRPEPITGPTTAGRPESIPRVPSAPAAAGRPEPAPPPVRDAPRQSARLPPCDDDGPPPSALGPDGVWRPTCAPRSAAVPTPAPAPGAAPPSRPAATTPAPQQAAPPGGSATSEAEQLRRQLEEERRRREAAERALRLNEALGRQGRN
jgi:hypothetical protein